MLVAKEEEDPLAPAENTAMTSEAQWSGQPAIKGSSEPVRMALLTTSLIGLQFTWGIEMTYCTPYLLQLGLSKSMTSMVWIAGPLSGLIMQPLVGVIADNSKSRWGRRRPFMIGGTAIVVLCLLVLGWTKELVGLFAAEESEAKTRWTIALAVIAIYAVDFAVNAVQASNRSLIVDTLPIPKQQLGSAWASRMVAVGHLVGYGIGTVHLREVWGDWLGNTQFKQMIWIAGFALAVTQGLTSWAVTERVLISSRGDGAGGAFKKIATIFKTTWNLPPRIQAICWVQFWAWIGWFPFLFYSPTWVGETYFRFDAPPEAQNSTDKLGEIGRVGSLSLVIFSCVTFAGSLLLPLVVRTPDKEDGKKPSKWARIKPDLLTAWLISHVIFAVTMIMAPAVQSLTFATVLVSLVGIPWALACWAPFAFIGEEVNKLAAPNTMMANGSRYQQVPDSDVDMQTLSPPSSPTTLRINHMRSDSILLDDGGDDVANSTGETSGIYLGILNLYTTLPQFVGSFIATIVFAIVEPGKSKILHGGDGDAVTDPDADSSQTGVNAIGVDLCIGAICALGAAYATWRLRDVS